MNNELPNNLTVKKHWLYRIAAELPLSSEGLENGLEKLGVLPSQKDWINWLNIIFLGLGVGLLLSGVIFFFAFNWEYLHRFVRFGILGSGVFLSAYLAYRKGVDAFTGKLLLTAASIFTGILLAAFGMVYQTGADSYLLFASWALLIFPWVLASKFQPLWMIWLVLINVAAIRWIGISNFGSFSGFDTFRTYMYIPLVINITILVFREATSCIQVKPNTGRWFPRIIAWFVLTMLSWIPLEGLFDNVDGQLWTELFWTYFLMLTGMIYYYFKVRHDLFMLVLTMLSIITVITSIFIYLLFKGHGEFGSLILVAILIIAETTLATKLVISISRKWKAEENIGAE